MINTSLGEYPGVIMTIVLRRKINYHLLQVIRQHCRLTICIELVERQIVRRLRQPPQEGVQDL